MHAKNVVCFARFNQGHDYVFLIFRQDGRMQKDKTGRLNYAFETVASVRFDERE